MICSVGGVESTLVEAERWTAYHALRSLVEYFDGHDVVSAGGTDWDAISELLGAQETAIEDKGGNHYTRVGGINITQQGWSASGEFIDITRFIDWLEARIKERIYFILANNPKVPYTDSGADLAVGAIKAQLQQGIAAGGLADTPVPTVTAPKVADIDPIDKANRHFPDIEFTGTLAGAIHSLAITGTLSV